MFRRRNIVTVIIILAVCLGLLIYRVSRHNNVQFLIAPSAATVVLDGKKHIKTGGYNLSVGSHTIHAAMTGFADAARSFTVTSSGVASVNLALAPNSAAGYAYLKAHPQEELLREKIGSLNFSSANKQAADANPIVKILPYVAADNSYRVDYGGGGQKTNIYITAISDQAVQAAEKWITGKGYILSSLALQTSIEPMLNHVPYNTTDFSLTADFGSTTTGAPKLNLDAVIQLSHADESNQDAAIAQYKQEVVDYINSCGVNAADYIVNYTVQSA